MNEHIVIEAADYGRIDGRNAYRSDTVRLTLGKPTCETNQAMKIAAQVWKKDADGNEVMAMEIPIHQVMDLMILLSRTMLHFRDAYRLPLLYDPQNPLIERVGMQGDAMNVRVCVENEDINEDIQGFERALSELGELTGERLRVLKHIVSEL